MIRGEFICGNGQILPNNITKVGAAHILSGHFRNEAPEFWLGLCDAVPNETLQIEDVLEPTLGVGGYARYEIVRSIVGWPWAGELNGERYIESHWVTWSASAAWDQTIRRLMLVTDGIAVTGDICALSAPLPALLQINELTPEVDRKFKYRVYLR